MLAFLLIAAGAVVVGSGLFLAVSPTPAPSIAQSATLGEVSDLIGRLKPLAKEPNAAWYSNGIKITFYGKGVAIELKTPNGNEYHGRADTLREAVARITSPSAEIQKALEGWAAPAEGEKP